MPIVGKRQRQRELTESVAKTLGVSKRQGRRVIAAQKKKATGQGDFFWGGQRHEQQEISVVPPLHRNGGR